MLITMDKEGELMYAVYIVNGSSVSASLVKKKKKRGGGKGKESNAKREREIRGTN